MSKNCTLCVFAMKPRGPDLNPPLQCWRFPPQMVAIPIPAGGIINGGKPAVSLQAMRPIVNANTTCGEFSPIEVANDKEAAG